MTPSNLMFEAVGYSELAEKQVEGGAAFMTEESAFVEEVLRKLMVGREWRWHRC